MALNIRVYKYIQPFQEFQVIVVGGGWTWVLSESHASFYCDAHRAMGCGVGMCLYMCFICLNDKAEDVLFCFLQIPCF